MTQTSHVDYEELCRLDVLGLRDSSEHDQRVVHADFKEQLERSPEGWYETGLPWKSNHPPLPSNEVGILRRLDSLTRKLRRDDYIEEYYGVIRSQLQEGIVEEATETSSSRKFYIPHKGVVKESSDTTKLRIVYDVSAKANQTSPSLNECLNTGPPLQNKLWDVLVQQRAFPVMVSGDIRQAFLQIRIKEAERDVLRFHWRKDGSSPLETLRFTRVLFGLAPSPYLLQGVIETQLDTWFERYPEVVEHLRRSMYVDDLISGGLTIEEAKTRKDVAREVLEDATFELHKWGSNVPQLEAEDGKPALELSVEQSYAKTQLQVKPKESKVLGLKWDKQSDTLKVSFPSENVPTTKRGILRKLSMIYDPLGLVSPLTLEGKLIFRDVCDAKIPWDAMLGSSHEKRWKAWERSLPAEEEVPRSIVRYQEPIEGIELHSFGDASTQGVGAAVYAVVKQPSGTTTQLVAAKSRLAKRSLTVPRLELVAAHMATNLMENVRNALPKELVPSMFAWLDSTVALHWICGNGAYKQFVGNRVAKIQEHSTIRWRHVPTKDNPADIASRGGQVSSSSLWWSGPEWLQDPAEWPENPVTRPSTETDSEAKIIREVLCVAKTTKPGSDEFDDLLESNTLRRTLRVFAWINRFIHNCRFRARRSGPLDTEEIETVKNWWIIRVQHRDATEAHYKETSGRLGLLTDDRGITVCGGRIQGNHPVYLPRSSVFTEKLVQRVHCETLHGGVGLTMAALRENFWIPRLRSLVKMVRKRCWGCKRFRLKAVPPPVPGLLPENRTTIATAFEVIGVDFAGPIRFRKSSKAEGKSYLAIFACSLSRAVHLELLRNLETGTFIMSFKRFIARRGRPRVIYSDNGGTFVKANKWLEQLRKDERLRGFAEAYEMKWKFNLSRAPWWGGQFERLIGIVKAAMYKVIGGGHLTWDELSEVLLDVEIQINRRPLTYVEDDVELPILTPVMFLHQRGSKLPEEEPWRVEERELRKRAKYILECKNKLWRRWRKEYLVALRERHNMAHKASKFRPKSGDVVLVRSDNKNRGKWPIAIVEETYPGKDNVVRAVRLKTPNGTLERAVQHLFPMELHCDVEKKPQPLNPEAVDFDPRPKRAAAVAARLRIQQDAADGNDEY